MKHKIVQSLTYSSFPTPAGMDKTFLSGRWNVQVFLSTGVSNLQIIDALVDVFFTIVVTFDEYSRENIDIINVVWSKVI